MTLTILPGELTGTVKAPASKSQAHRLFICAALGKRETVIECGSLSKDIEATIACLNALGADIRETTPGEFAVKPIGESPKGLRELFCGESGSTLRFLLPVVGVLGAETVFRMEGRLPERPIFPLDRELTSHGMKLRKEGDSLYCSGKLTAGEYTLPGDVSSQYISGLLMALPMLGEESAVTITGRLESASYIDMTTEAQALAGVTPTKTAAGYAIPAGAVYSLPERTAVEGDWSGAAFYLCAGAMSGKGITVTGLNPKTTQGDRAVIDILRAFGAEVTEKDNSVTVKKGTLRGVTIDAPPIPDLIPVLCAVSAAAEGETKIINAARLRLKESDRLSTTADYLKSLGVHVTEEADGLTVTGGGLVGGRLSAHNDHRIAMAAAVAACGCAEPVTIEGCSCVKKSYARFWEDYTLLKGRFI